jgi:protein involved in sex pheromone biosynthesis
MKVKNFLYAICCILLLSSCANKVEKTTLGDDATLFKESINIHTELKPKGLEVTVSNLRNEHYALWLTYKYNCADKRGKSEAMVYSGDDIYKTVLINIPTDTIKCHRSFNINLKDAQGNDLYFSPLLEIKPVELRSSGGTRSLGD